MQNPVEISLPKDQWVKVASNVLNKGVISKKKGIAPINYMYTYRLAGEAAPTDDVGAIEFIGNQITPGASAPIDVYVKAVNSQSSVVVSI